MTDNDRILYASQKYIVIKKDNFRAMPWIRWLSTQPLTTEAWVHSQVSPCAICSGQSGSGQIFLQVLWFSPANIIPPMLHTPFIQLLLMP